MEDSIYVVKIPPKDARLVAKYTQYETEGRIYLEVDKGRFQPFSLSFKRESASKLGRLLWGEDKVQEPERSQEDSEVHSQSQQ